MRKKIHLKHLPLFLDSLASLWEKKTGFDVKPSGTFINGVLLGVQLSEYIEDHDIFNDEFTKLADEFSKYES